MEFKICNKCNEEKPNTNEYFAFSNKPKGLLKSSCKMCDKEYYKKNRDKIINQYKEYYRNNKEAVSMYKKEYYKDNKDKMIENATNYRKNNREKVSEYLRDYQRNNKDKMVFYANKRRCIEIGNGGNYTKEQWKETLEYFDYKCAYTGECIKDNLNIEHIIPVSKGGTNYIWNLVPSTPQANISKKDRDIEEWYRKQPYFSEERLQNIYKYQEYMKSKFPLK